MSNLPNRQHSRLKNYDYAQSGMYFVTICTYQKHQFLSEVVGRGLAPAEIHLLPAGLIVKEELDAISRRFPCLKFENTVIMPNHIHLLLLLSGTAGASSRPTDGATQDSDRENSGQSLVDVVRVLKSITTRRWNAARKTQGEKLWQTSFHDHIIRDEHDFLNHWNYIDINPAKWADDEYFMG